MTTEPRVYDATPVFLFDGRTCLCSHADVLTVANPENKLKFGTCGLGQGRRKRGKTRKIDKTFVYSKFSSKSVSSSDVEKTLVVMTSTMTRTSRLVVVAQPKSFFRITYHPGHDSHRCHQRSSTQSSILAIVGGCRHETINVIAVAVAMQQGDWMSLPQRPTRQRQGGIGQTTIE